VPILWTLLGYAAAVVTVTVTVTITVAGKCR